MSFPYLTGAKTGGAWRASRSVSRDIAHAISNIRRTLDRMEHDLAAGPWLAGGQLHARRHSFVAIHRAYRRTCQPGHSSRRLSEVPGLVGAIEQSPGLRPRADQASNVQRPGRLDPVMEPQQDPAGASPQPQRPDDNIRLGIGLIALFSLTIPVIGSSVKILGQTLPILQITWTRFLLQIIIIGVAIAVTSDAFR